MKTPNIEEIEESIREFAEKVISFIKGHKKLIAVLTVFWIIFYYLVDDRE